MSIVSILENIGCVIMVPQSLYWYFLRKNGYNDVFLLVFIEPSMWIWDKGPSPAVADQSESSASGEAKVPATPVSTGDATAY